MLTMDRQSTAHAGHRYVIRPLLLLLLCLLGPAIGEDTSHAVRLEVLLSNDRAPYRQLAEQFSERLLAICPEYCPDMPEIRISLLRDWQSDTPRDLLIAVGNDAAMAAASVQISPTLYGFIPERTWLELAKMLPAESMARDSAVFIDQPAARQLRLIRAIVPEQRNKVGLLLGPESQYRLQAVSTAARELGLKVTTEYVDKVQDVGPAARALNGNVDVLLALPDTTVYNRNTLYGILLTSYDARVPLVGYSEALSKAGAMVSLYTSISDMAAQLAEHATGFLNNDGHLPPSGYSKQFHIAVNHRVAHSLGFYLPDEAEIRFRMMPEGALDAATPTAK